MAFFEYNQNNSGGGFDFQEWKLTNYVIIEANSDDDANFKALSLGLYFDGDGDCSCCGDRWYEAYGTGDKVPSHYGTPVAEATETEPKWHVNWMGENPDIYVHYLDGRVEAYKAGHGLVGVQA